MLEGASATAVSLHGWVQYRSVWLINDCSLTSNLQPFYHRQEVASLSFLSLLFCFWSSKVVPVVPVPMTCFSRIEAVSHPYQVFIRRCWTSLFLYFFLRDAYLWSTLSSVFPTTCRLSVFKRRTNNLGFTWMFPRASLFTVHHLIMGFTPSIVIHMV